LMYYPPAIQPQLVYYPYPYGSPVIGVPQTLDFQFQNMSLMNQPRVVSQSPIFVSCPTSIPFAPSC
jgi:hypothetical protein